MIELKPTKKYLLKFLKNLRDEDKKELKFHFSKNTNNKFIKSLKKLHEFYFVADDNFNPIAIGGVEINKNNGFGQVWLLCSKSLYDNKKSLYKYVKNKISKFKKKFNVLYNYIYKTNFQALVWLEHFGFSSFELENPDFKIFYTINGDKEIDLRYFTCE